MKIGYSHGYLVTANDDGSVPLNSKILAKIDEAEPEFINRVINSVNQRDELYEAISKAIRLERPSKAKPFTTAAFSRENTCDGIATNIADAFKQVSGDPTFDRARFLKACGVEE